MCKNLYFHLYIFLFLYFSIEFFEGVSRGGPYRWSMDRSVRWSVDPVRWTGPRTGGQCFRVTPSFTNQTDRFWKILRNRGLAHLRNTNPPQPLVLLLAAPPPAHDVVDCLATKLAEVLDPRATQENFSHD